jgi:hypothetical protein
MKQSIKYVLVALTSIVVTLISGFFLDRQDKGAKFLYENSEVILSGSEGHYVIGSKNLTWSITVTENSSSIFVNTIVADIYGDSINVFKDYSSNSAELSGVFFDFTNNVNYQFRSNSGWIKEEGERGGKCP